MYNRPKTTQNWSENKSILLMLILLGLMVAGNTSAQIQLSYYFDFAGNNSSDGMILKTAAFGEYQWERTTVTGGLQLDFKSRNENVFSGINFNVDQNFTVKEFPFSIEGLFLYNRFSKLVHESSWAVLANIERKHFRYQLGTHFRTYSVTQKAKDEYDIDSDEKIHENWNIIYRIEYNLKPFGNDWNVGATITNMDHFVISQETNPWLNVQGEYTLSAPLTLFAQAWLKNAGMFNISVNSFGYLFRTGIIWRIG